MTIRIFKVNTGPWGNNSLAKNWPLLLFGLCGSFAQIATAPASPAIPPQLTEIRAVLRLPMGQARLRIPVRIKQGVVTLSVPENRLLFVQDKTGGILVETTDLPASFRAGELVEVNGFTGIERLRPVIVRAQVSVLGKGNFPPALACSFSELLEGNLEGHWIETQGVVHSVRREAGLVLMNVANGAIHLPVLVQDFPDVNSRQLLDSKIQLHGVFVTYSASSNFPSKEQLWIPRGFDIKIVEPAHENPFSLPVHSFQQLTQIPPTELPLHRLRIRGTILTISNSGAMLLQDGTGYLQVFPAPPIDNAEGDIVEGVGFAATKDNRVVLENVSLRNLQTAATNFKLEKGLPLLSSIIEVRRLSATEANRGYPVKVRGVITYYDEELGGAFLQDERSAIYISAPAQFPGLQTGSLAVVEGFTYPGGVSPMIFYPKIKNLGNALLPKALQTPIDRLTRGENDCLRIEIQGIVRHVYGQDNFARLDIMSGGKRILLQIPKFQGKQLPVHLVGAQVRVRGICTSLLNDRGQLAGFGMLAPTIEDVVVEQPAVADNQTSPAKMIKEVPRVNPDEVAGRQVRIEGNVLLQLLERSLYVQDASGTIYVQTRQATVVPLGTRISVIGFPNFVDGELILEDALFRVLEAGSPPKPKMITAADAQEGRFLGELVRLEGKLMNQIQTDSGRALVLQSQESIFEALLDKREQPFQVGREGSLLEVTGICVLKRRLESQGNTFQILLRSAQDVRVLRPAPWWTTARLVGAVGFLCFILLVAGTWGITLRRRVNKQILLIQARLEREAALEKEYRDLFENSNDVVFAMNLEGKFISINRAGEKIFGYTREELQRIPFFQLLGPEHQATASKCIQKIMARDACPPVELEVIARDERRVSMEINFDLIQQEGRSTGFRAIARDVTERKQAEQSLRAAEERLLQSQKMEAIGTMAGGIAHDFNNILGAILGYAELTLLETNDAAQVSANLEQIIKAGQRARDLVQQILAFSRKLQHERKPVLMQTVLKDAHKLLRATFPSTIEINLQMDQACKPVLADATQLHQVIMNLATNSYHALKSSGGRLEILLYPQIVEETALAKHTELQKGEYSCLEIRDSGHGMDEGTLKHIFEPYFTTKPVGAGTGLGLAVVHGIVQEYKGAILVDSKLGVGTTFQILLPCCKVEIPEEDLKTKVELPQGKGHILFVDDEKSIVDLTKRTLEKMGYTVTPQTSSLEALEWFRSKPDSYDLVCTDQTMPQMTGVTLIRELQAIRPDLPIILCTGFSDEATPEKAHQLGVFRHFYKPVNMKELAEAIREALPAQNRSAQADRA
jgi:PAS domain S-box-containing protein